MKNLGPALLLVSSFSLLGGCKEYFAVDEACPKRVPGKYLSPVEADAMLRLNCHRRLAQVSAAVPNELVSIQARNVLDYLLQNPVIDGLLGEEREHFFLKQVTTSPGYTGSSVADRLTNPTTGVGYVYFDTVGSGTREFIDVLWTFDPATNPLPSGAAAVDYLMKDPEFRQNALQPSWLDGAYAEVALPPAWFDRAGFAEQYGRLPVEGRAYYLVSIYTQPHIEHADSPVIYPKEGQLKVPLYGVTHVPNDAFPGENFQTGFPITFTFGAIDAVNFFPIEFNQYRGALNSISVDGPDGPVDLKILMPGDIADGSLPDGTWVRTTLTAYPTTELQPNTKYRVKADVSSEESEWEYDYEFTTGSAEADPGLNPDLMGVAPPPVTSTGI